MSALAEKDSNVRLSPSKSQQSSNECSQSTSASENEESRKRYHDKVAGTNGTYISPSDAIMSPASQKLASFKQKQISRQNDTTRRSLFARTLSKNSEKRKSNDE